MPRIFFVLFPRSTLVFPLRFTIDSVEAVGDPPGVGEMIGRLLLDLWFPLRSSHHPLQSDSQNILAVIVSNLAAMLLGFVNESQRLRWYLRLALTVELFYLLERVDNDSAGD